MSGIPDFVTAYGKEIGLTALALNEEGICALTFDEKINVDILYRKEQDQLIFISKVGNLPIEGKEAFYMQLLKGNAFGTETAGASLGIDEEENAVILSYVLIASMLNYDLFKTVLGNFVDLAEEWLGKTENFSSNAIGPAVSTGADALGVPFGHFSRV